MKEIQARKVLKKNWQVVVIDFEELINDDGHGVICMVCYWHNDKYSVKAQELDHDKFDYCQDHIKKKHTIEEIEEYLDNG